MSSKIGPHLSVWESKWSFGNRRPKHLQCWHSKLESWICLLRSVLIPTESSVECIGVARSIDSAPIEVVTSRQHVMRFFLNELSHSKLSRFTSIQNQDRWLSLNEFCPAYVEHIVRWFVHGQIHHHGCHSLPQNSPCFRTRKAGPAVQRLSLSPALSEVVNSNDKFANSFWKKVRTMICWHDGHLLLTGEVCRMFKTLKRAGELETFVRLKYRPPWMGRKQNGI